MQSSVERTYAPFFEPDYMHALRPVQRFETPAGGDVWDILIAYRLEP
jgi:hypothetical protein